MDPVRHRAELVALTEAAVAVALSVLLGGLRLVELPNGGSITLACLPLLTLAVTRGVRAGVLAGACAGAAHALSGGIVVHPAQLLLDYVLAYAALGAAGARAGGALTRARLAPGIVLAMSLQLASMVLSGVVFFAPVAGGAAWIYSLAYNLATQLPELLLALWLVPPLAHALARANPADSWRRGLLQPPRIPPRSPRPIHATTPIDTTPSTPNVSRPTRPVSLTRQSTTFTRPAPFVRRSHLHPKAEENGLRPTSSH